MFFATVAVPNEWLEGGRGGGIELIKIMSKHQFQFLYSIQNFDIYKSDVKKKVGWKCWKQE